MNDEAKLEIRRREARKELPQGRVIVFVPLRSFRCRPVFFSSSVYSRFQSVAHNSNPEHNGVSGVQACRVSRNSLKSQKKTRNGIHGTRGFTENLGQSSRSVQINGNHGIHGDAPNTRTQPQSPSRHVPAPVGGKPFSFVFFGRQQLVRLTERRLIE